MNAEGRAAFAAPGVVAFPAMAIPAFSSSLPWSASSHGSPTTLRGFFRRFRCLAIAVLASALSACGGSADRKPDTGYGAAQTVPADVNCTALCERESDCFAHLCNEDTKSTKYTGLASLLADQCNATCSDTALKQKVTASAWACLFQSSCRMAIGEDVCDAMAKYECM